MSLWLEIKPVSTKIEGISEDLQKIFDDDSKFARLVKKVIRDERSFEVRIQRIQELQNYLEKSENSKVINRHSFVYKMNGKFFFDMI